MAEMILCPHQREWYVGKWLAVATRGRIILPDQQGEVSPAALRAMKEGYAVATSEDEIWVAPWTKGTKLRSKQQKCALK